MMMPMAKLHGFAMFVPATLLLTVSFFVLVQLRKIEEQGLKFFGHAVVVLLWLSAALIFSTGMYNTSKCCSMMSERQGMMGHSMKSMGKCMDKTGMPAEMKVQQ
ncbi:MAG: hypothetical protein WCI77_05235 [Candidatus Omnitrophota bacterium]